MDGKVNPEKWEIAVSVANVLGVRSICIFNDYRERLVASRAMVNRRSSMVNGEHADDEKPASPSGA